MKKPASITALALLASIALVGCDAQNPNADPVELVSDENAAMNAAIAEAQATLPEWLGVLENPPEGYENIVFKYPLEGSEHIWVDNVVRDGDVLTGTLSNNPVNGAYTLGDPVRVPLSDVSDWAYFDAGGVAHGYHTVRVLFDQMDPAEVAAIKQRFGWTD